MRYFTLINTDALLPSVTSEVREAAVALNKRLSLGNTHFELFPKAPLSSFSKVIIKGRLDYIEGLVFGKPSSGNMYDRVDNIHTKLTKASHNVL